MKWSKTNTPDTRRLRILIHGQSGVGKTWLARTVPDPARCLLIAAEPGELSLADVAMPMVKLSRPAEIIDVCEAAKSDKGQAAWDWIYLDSLSALADSLLDVELAKGGDGRAAYGEMQRAVVQIVREYLHGLPQHVVVTCRQERVIIDGRLLYVPGLPGQTLTHKSPIAHEFDAVWGLTLKSGTDDKPTSRWLQTQAAADPSVTAKTRDPFGKILPWERPNLAVLAGKLLAPAPAKEGEA